MTGPFKTHTTSAPPESTKALEKPHQETSVISLHVNLLNCNNKENQYVSIGRWLSKCFTDQIRQPLVYKIPLLGVAHTKQVKH